MLPIDDVVHLNQFAQGIRPITEAKGWFDSISTDQKRIVLHELSVLSQEAYARPDEVPLAIDRAGLRPTFTPCVLMARGPIRQQAGKVIALPESEYAKAFLLFLALFAIADERRRRTECANGCSHWWHQDLADEITVRRILHES